MQQETTPQPSDQTNSGQLPEQMSAAELDSRARRDTNRFFAVIGIGFILLFGGCVTYHTLNPSKAEQSADWPIAGEQGILRLEDRGDILLTPDLDSFKRLMNAGTAKDDYGLRELHDEGKIFGVSDSTKVKYLEGEGFAGAVRVRLLNGSHQGEAAWTARKAFQKSP